MNIQPDNRPHVVIVGGGVGGLSAAWYLRNHARCTVLEAGDRWGGKVYTHQIDFDGGPLNVETGPDGFITRKPWAYDLVQELGLADQAIGVNKLPERIYVLRRGKLVSLPQGLHLLVPTQILPFLRSPLLSWPGKLRVLAERFIPAKTEDADESLADFVTRRLGAEALHNLAEPMLGGVYNANPNQQSILATFPQFRRMEAEHGSLIKGMRAAMQARAARPATDKPELIAFKDGMRVLVDALVDQLPADMFLDTPVQTIQPVLEGGYDVFVDEDSPIYADAVILAVPGRVAATLTQNLAPESSGHLGKIRYEGVGIATLAFKRSDVPHPLDAYGVVIPGGEGRQIDGITWSSAKWPNRAPADTVLMRVFFGGPNTRHMIDLPDDDVLATVRRELQTIIGVSAEPIYQMLTRWPQAYPQYDVGHKELVTQIEASMPTGLYVVGKGYHGVGLPDTIHHAKRTAAHIVETLPQSLRAEEK